MKISRIPAVWASMEANHGPTLDLIVRALLYVYIFSLPFLPLLVVERNIFLVLLVLLPLWCLLRRRHFFVSSPVDLPLIAFVAWVAFTIPFSAHPAYSMKEFGKLLQQVVIFYAVLYFFRERTARDLLTYLLLGCVLVVSAYGITQFQWYDGQATRSFFPAEVWLTTYLVLLGPLFFSLAYYEVTNRLRYVYGCGSILVTICLLMTRSRAGLVALFVELWVMAWLLKRRSAVTVAGGATVVCLLAALFLIRVDTGSDGQLRLTLRDGTPVRTDGASVIHRFDIWAFALSKIQEHWFVGIGYGKDNYKLVYGDEPEEVQPGHHPVKTAGAHNIVLASALHVGLIGMVLFLWLWGKLVRRLIQECHRTEGSTARAIVVGATVGVIGLGVRLMFDQMLVGTLAVQFWVVVGIAVLHVNSQRESDREGVVAAVSGAATLAGARSG
ncbi:MAG: O-antigen ligase family protein [Nitrospira sp.]|nr:O-antigen ligase family protein [Nitrospira sp.]MBX7039442.1 O-antigen ligase family protein [Nitrospira sp.]MCW5795706.1 O-antigen ligase family protein [Nitrospira sp.]HMU31541.1 O-antigen ligase family protein [Nitrospira sp.]HMV59010.1 O-antigen ligase family protein [Nitrospira sp.]